ncbi:hypothetical protein V0288_22220 [Pannus brasiliensis CCIBt3594]|uniref:Uncharacterized protein n=1 Tax=Pannus brasiliensis CCIBt3594 TaxID=1427578 RepID=A0AAW9QQ13_9CHRO
MPKGGLRPNALKSSFNSSGKKVTLRVPESILDEVKFLARLVDEGLIEVQPKEGVNLAELVTGYHKGKYENGYQAGNPKKLIQSASLKINDCLLDSSNTLVA